MTSDTSSTTPAHDPTGGVKKVENMPPHEKVSHGPADYAARLTRLQTLGAGEGLGKHQMRDGTLFWCGEVCMPLPDELAVGWLESCLRDALIGCPAVLFRQENRLIQINDSYTYAKVYIGRCLLEAADAVIAHLEAK